LHKTALTSAYLELEMTIDKLIHKDAILLIVICVWYRRRSSNVIFYM